MEEEWKEIIDYPGYFISNFGNVMNIHGRILKGYSASKNYRMIDLKLNGTRNRFYIHRLVATHFIDNPENKKIVDHINHDVTNNTISNLRWATMTEQNRNIRKHKNKTSTYKGVSYDKRRQKWESYIHFNRKKMSLGFFDDEHCAAQAYNNYITNNKLEYFILNDIPK
jgi:hypothetical protein